MLKLNRFPDVTLMTIRSTLHFMDFFVVVVSVLISASYEISMKYFGIFYWSILEKTERKIKKVLFENS
jgi:hypothetical protein